MDRWFASGHIVDAILAFMLVEAALLILARARSRRGPTALELAVSLSAGAALLLALRAALVGSGWRTIAVWLAVALAAHLWDLSARLRAERAR